MRPGRRQEQEFGAIVAIARKPSHANCAARRGPGRGSAAIKSLTARHGHTARTRASVGWGPLVRGEMISWRIASHQPPWLMMPRKPKPPRRCLPLLLASASVSAACLCLCLCLWRTCSLKAPLSSTSRHCRWLRTSVPSGVHLCVCVCVHSVVAGRAARAGEHGGRSAVTYAYV